MRSLLQDAYALVRQNLVVAANRRKKRYDMNVRAKDFQVGDEVWVFVSRRRLGRYPKWEKFYQGPFVVLEKTGPLNYRVQKKPKGKIFVTHADKLILRRCTDEAEQGATNGEENLDDEVGTARDTERAGDTSSPRALRPRNVLRKPARFAD